MSKSALSQTASSASILVNGRYSVHRITGVQRYAREIVARLGDHVEVCTPESAKGAVGHLWEQTVLRRRAGGRLLWNPCGSGPLELKNQVTTFHDLFPVEHPEWYSPTYARWYGTLMRRLASQALHVIAVSEYTKSRLVQVTGRDPDSITVVHNGISDSWTRASDDEIRQVRKVLRIPGRRYVLSLSSQESRKNLRCTLEAWARIHAQLDKDVWLVLAGPAADENVYGRQRDSHRLPRVLFTGYVAEEYLRGLYSGASLFVFPSLAEGFGLPLLEAMACGVRCISSRTSSLPEVGGSAVEYIDPFDSQELADKMLRTLARNAESFSTPFEPAIRQAQRFSWDAAAKATRAVLDRVAEQQGENIRSTKRRGSVSFVRPRHATSASQQLSVTLVHDWLTGMRGGEKVLESLCRRFPGAPLRTLLYNQGSVSEIIANREILPSLLQRMPFAATKYRNYLPLFPLFAEWNKAHNTDLVVSTSHAVAKSMVGSFGKKRPFHICYVHTPMRYAWDMFADYFGPERVGWLASTIFFRPIMSALQLYDKATVHRVDMFVANSTYVAERIRRIYGRASDVLPPPVNTERYIGVERAPEDWYLVVSALVPYKRVDHAIRACHALRRKLRIVGKGPEAAALKELASALQADVEFIGFASDDVLANYYRQAKALLFPGIEDFGIVPLEAIASGCPVVALGIGGVLDSMTEETAVFYTDESVQGLTAAIRSFEERAHLFSTERLRERAMMFSEDKFLSRFEQILNQANAIRLQARQNTAVPPLAVSAME